MKSFIKWTGSKYRIIEKIKPYFPAAHRLIEPFVDSAAVFLNTTYASYLLADTNHDLIHLYQYLKKDGRIFINYCRSFFRPEFNDPEAFYHLRSVFNNSNNSRKRAALLLYLNKHCFNGLARLIKKDNLIRLLALTNNLISLKKKCFSFIKKHSTSPCYTPIFMRH
ncbi:Dam family site-specific DNA-(adenine-N6)-methyltransferase [Rickettsiella massiliensis]|uniref:Dam family site-specific DNA-(adenine-N6)-methyltransferase n=1 Tax=Rickettsiella massiliensis TaxID=676517 RepID=UPI00029A721E|nr:Dam family site-specific DNA-(adenine-N6)-methyltransferase [Rickettsiella massiliensis]